MESRGRSRSGATPSRSKSRPRALSRPPNSRKRSRDRSRGGAFPPRPHTIGDVKKAAHATHVAQVWEGVERAHTSMSAALERDMVPEAGMPLAWYQVLLHLSRAEGGMMRYQDLARCAGISNSGASRRLDQMTRSGLIERRLCATDRRGVFAHITPRGRQRFRGRIRSSSAASNATSAPA